MLPNFMCIGAQKSGTTTIWHLLNAHPDIFMAQPRETRFFYDELQFAEGVQKYEINYFSAWAGQPSVGEKCPEYLYVPAVARRIHDTLGPRMKFIVALRSPAQRAFSHYRHNLAMFRECRPFHYVLEDEQRLLNDGLEIKVPYGYLARGYYASQLRSYLKMFDRDRFLLVNFEREVDTDQKALSDRLYDFLEVQRHFPEGLPFYSGHPRLENLAIHISTVGENPKEHYVEIGTERFGLRRFIQRISGKDQADGGKKRIYRPSDALVRFAREFSRNKPVENKLSRNEELEINHRYFLPEIKGLMAITQFDLRYWIE